MMIEKKRISQISNYISHIPKKSFLVCGVPVTDALMSRILDVGFPKSLENGVRVLPSLLGPTSTFNSEGKFIVLKNMPKEATFRQKEIEWMEIVGNSKSKAFDLLREAYPKQLIPPPSIELYIIEPKKGEKIIVSDPIRNINENSELIKHHINLFLELFAGCEVYKSELTKDSIKSFKRMYWDVLETKKCHIEKIECRIDNIIANAEIDYMPLLRNRISKLKSKNPDFVAIGHAGFEGYVIFGFKHKNLFICESRYNHNATYVFKNSWKEVSRLTKAEILVEGPSSDRLIHRRGWEEKIDELIG